MTLTDQQLRQDLISYGETVPPITQRNREQLRARLEVLQSRTRTRTPASPARAQTTASPSRSQATASPSRTSRAAASPARTPTTNAAASSPSRTTRAVASPARTLVASSPSRTRSSMTTTTLTSRPSTRSSMTTTPLASRPSTGSQQTTNLIELSDSETDSTSAGALRPRSTRSGQTAASTVQTRATASRRQTDSPTSPTTDMPGPAAVFGDVEQSIARHRREIKQLLDSARDRNRISNANTPPKSVQENEQNGTPVHPSSKTRAHRKVSKSDTEEAVSRSPKPSTEEHKKSTAGKSPGKSCWGKYGSLIKNLLKVLLFGSIIIGSAYFIYQNRDFFSPPKEINCSAKDATTCEDMKVLVATVRKQLQTRTGEVECGVRQKNDVFVSKSEVENYLNEQGLTFTAGDKERWNALVNYVLNGDAKDILVWNKDGKATKSPADIEKLSTKAAIHSLECYIRQDVSDQSKRIFLLVSGIAGLLTLFWFIRKQFKASKETEKKVKVFLEKVTDILKEQGEKHIQDPQSKPWVAINQIHDTLLPKEEQQKLKNIWERVKKQINKDNAQFSSETQEVDGKNVDVWRWLNSTSASPKKTKSENVKNSAEETDPVAAEVGLTECLKLRNCFRSDKYIDEAEINSVIEIIRKRCADVKSIDHIGVHTFFVYLKFSSKEAAAQGYHLLNEWNCQSRPLNVKYIRLSRYHDHFPEARAASPK